MALRQQAPAEEHRREPDRDVDPEDPVPVDRFRDRSADDRPERHGETREPTVDADDHASLLRRVRRRQNREAEWEDDGRAEPLDRARGDQLGRAWGERAHGRGNCEQRQAAVEDEAAAEAIAKRGGSDDARREGDSVRIDRPLQR